MSYLSSQDIRDFDFLPVESLILVCSLDYDGSVDLNAGVKTARFKVGKNGSTIDV
jgi:hypothetical protein